MKRLFDLGASVLGLAFFVPFAALIVILIRTNSEGPGIFRQDRVGRNGRIFRCYKFRTMRHGVANVPSHHASAAEITSIGRFLRRTKIDELPQLWNVLRGEMSLVGPRPCLPSQTELIDLRDKLGVLALRPGITGLSQIRKIDMSTPSRLAESDADYLRQQSFGLDIRILLRTLMTGSS